MFSSSRNFLAALKLQPLLATATEVQRAIRQGLPMADDLDLRVLRLGYDEKIVEKFKNSNGIFNTNVSSFISVNHHDENEKKTHVNLFRLIDNFHSRGARGSACSAIVRLPFSEKMLRPGGSSSGPTMMCLADASMFAVSLAITGKPLAVTTNFQINFFRKPMAQQELVAEARLCRQDRFGESRDWNVFDSYELEK